MNAADVMTTDVVSVAPDATIVEAARLMLQRRISGLPVIDAAGHLVGIVSEGDFLRRSELATERQRPRWLAFLLGPGWLAADYVHTHGRKVAEVMTRSVVTVAENSPLDHVVDLMERYHVKRLPVVRGDRVVGIVTRTNLLRAVAAAAGELGSAVQDDLQIHRQLAAELKKQAWAGVGLISPTVRDGTVHLWGTISDERARTAAIVAAENIPGVKDVYDHLAWFEPVSGITIEAQDSHRTSDAA